VLLADAISRPGAIITLINDVKLAIHDQYLKIVLKLYFHMRSHFLNLGSSGCFPDIENTCILLKFS
jgi:hypothetical protein